MKLVMPVYCREFGCIADKCHDNCCIGWGIYIDASTYDRYKSIGGEFGERLKNNIDHEEQCFINDSDHRCPFLNENNLCDIIITLGEDKLCEICDRHPRYFEWLDDRIEGGIGLCCEEAARIVLGADGFETYEAEAPESLCCDDDEEPCDELYQAFLEKARDNIIGLLLDRDLPLAETLSRLCAYAELLQDCTDEYEIAQVPEAGEEYREFDTSAAIGLMLKTEPIDEGQPSYLRGLYGFAKGEASFDEIAPENERELRNIAVYFVWRYFIKAVFSGEIYSKLMLAVFAVKVINAMFNFEMSSAGEITFERKCALAKYFSKIAEYSEDNLDLILESYNY